ncbi:MAG: DUF1566 domain-containing protein [Thermodesulfobacteriota bacterium]|nr:DUF1566 domain-containing protein [Thermodesulfobacteriota bacterium]
MQKCLFILCLMALSACATFNEVDQERFQVNANATVLDEKTELMWAAIDNLQNLTWMEAEEYCKTFTGGGYEDWRMPKKSELAALIEAKIEKEGEIIHLSSNLIWASETEDSKGAYCNFKMRGCSWMEKAVSITLRALPVRDTRATTSIINTSTAERIKPPSPTQRLQIIDSLHRQQLITKDEYNRKKAAILEEL